jgi:hypothetical protein
MNKSIFVSDIIASNKLYTNTMTANLENNKPQVYKWTIETKMGVFTGTSLSIDEVNKEIAMLTNNARIIKKNIIPTSSTNESEEDKIYTWNVITNSGKASGISTSLKEAQSALNSFGTTEVVKSNIAESFTASK